MAGAGQRSLGTIAPLEIGELGYFQTARGEWRYRLEFVDGAGTQYRLSVSDLAFRYYLDYLRLVEHQPAETVAQTIVSMLKEAEIFLRIGLARHWEKYPDRCFLQITGLHTFPDYLDGRCFDDFAPDSSCS
jgi:hypothetical protein